MTYGAKIYNDSGDVVIDDEGINYLLTSSGTLTGSVYQYNNALYEYSTATYPQITFPAFVKLNVGEFVGVGGAAGGLISSQSSLEVLSLKPAKDIADPTGYDVVFYDASGNKTWIASSSIVVLNSSATISAFGSVSSDADYVAVLTALPYFQPTGNPQIFNSVLQGVERTSSTTYSWAGRGVGAAPPVSGIGPYPVACLFAKSN